MKTPEQDIDGVDTTSIGETPVGTIDESEATRVGEQYDEYH